MTKYTKQVNLYIDNLYNSVLLLCRNTLFYTKFDLIDTFQNRIHLIFIHISFIFIKVKQSNKNQTYRNFQQKVFDLVLNKIELNMREIGYGDTTINKNMRHLVKTFYTILFYCEKYKKMNTDAKNQFFIKYLKLNNIKNTSYNMAIIGYFNQYETFCFDLTSDSVLKGELNFNYK